VIGSIIYFPVGYLATIERSLVKIAYTLDHPLDIVIL